VRSKFVKTFNIPISNDSVLEFFRQDEGLHLHISDRVRTQYSNPHLAEIINEDPYFSVKIILKTTLMHEFVLERQLIHNNVLPDLIKNDPKRS